MRTRTPLSMTAFLLFGILAAGLQATAQAPARLLGTVTALNGTTITMKTDAGETRQVAVPSGVPIKRVAPGQKDLSAAETIEFSGLANGDRVLVRLNPDAAGEASQVIAIKQTDVAAKQEKDREDWQRRGVGGLVKSVDANAGTIVVTSGTGPTAKAITVHTTKSTLLKRYAPASVSYDAAKPAPITAIQAGDQLRARGAKNADSIEAEEIVSGSFRNISGTISSIDAAKSAFIVKDLATKKQVTVQVSPDAQMRKLPEEMARMLAARLKGGAPVGGRVAARGPEPGNGAPNGHDPQQMLSRAPAIQLADLKKGDAVMIVSTATDNDVTAITLLAGVEPLLEAPAAQNLLANWSMGGGTPEGAQ